LTASLPRRIYHYTSRSAGHGILKSGSIWATHVRCLNEPAGYPTGFDIISGLLGASPAARNDAPLGELMGQWLAEMSGIGRDHRLVACFSDSPDSLTQWRSGARDGFALAFDPLALEALTVPSDYILAACLYETSEHERLCASVFRDTVDIYHRSIAHGQSRDVAAIKAKRLFEVLIASVLPQIKHRAARDEGEYRLVSTTPVKFRPQGKLRSRHARGVAIPYEAVDFSTKSGHHALQEIIVATGVDYEAARVELQSLLSDGGYTEIGITPAVVARHA
jgi:hypothetical protein